ncbi:MAG TPA: immunoglobulin domain-containing protein [Prosthecobacter sp.]|nr:immunoglobulin domain-containing protein [Prosthecobacter sp.]
MALVISHELGHTFGLSHDGTSVQGYYSGHGSGATSWGPIMGAPYSRTMTQWSIGEYNAANNSEDDVAIIANVTNDVGFVTDEGGNDIATAVDRTPPNGVVSLPGILSSSNDPDYFMLKATAAPMNLTCAPSSPFPNADLILEVYAADGALIGTGSSDTSLSGTVSIPIPTAGDYYIAVYPQGNGSVFTGYSNYGSIGAYVITGNFTTIPSTPQFVVQPLSVTVIEGGTATLTGQAITTGGVGYQWFYANNPLSGTGTQASTLRLSAIKPTQAGLYKLLATNATNANFFAFSNEVMVTVNSKPKIVTPPVKATVLAGTDHTFTVTATGTPPLVYTWEKDNKTIVAGPGPDASLTLTSADLTDVGNYRVKVTNATGVVVMSAAVALKVDSPPVITLQPAADTAIAVGGSTTLKIAAKGNSPFTYQWFMVGSPDPIAKATSASLVVKAAGTYYAKVFNAIGGAVGTQSTDAVVVVHAKPVITGQPVAPAVIPTGEVTPVDLTVTATGGGTLTYQWQKDGKNITLAQNATANSPTLTFNPIRWTDRGAYKCIVRNRVGSVTSKTVTIKVDSAPIVITQPLNPTYGPTGGGVSFTVLAGGSPTLKYQWYFNSLANPIAKATTNKLSLTKLTPANEGMYFCRVSNTLNGGSFVDSSLAELIVEDLPKITAITSTEALNKHKVVLNGSITLSATTTGLINTYQWLKAGKALVGKTQSTLTLSPAQVAESGSYTLQVTNNVGKATSTALAVAVLIPPTINQVPVGVSTYETSPATISIKASGSPTLRYQWEKSLPGGGYLKLTGKTAPVLSFGSVTLSDAGLYRCVVSNDVGTATSLDALLSVTQVPPATITQFLPARGMAGELVRLTGSNLQYVSAVKFGTTNANVFTIVSDSEILITAPIMPAGSSVEISLTSKGTGGTVSSGPTRTYTRTASYGNDQRIDARIMNGTNVSMDGNNTGFTDDDFYDYQYASAWYWWTAPRAGTYQLQVTENFDSVVVVYRGRPDSSTLNYVSYTDSSWGAGEIVNVTATAGQSLLFQVSSFYANANLQGQFGIYLSPVTFTMPTPEMAAEGGTQPEAPAPVPSDKALRLGGGGVASLEPVVLVEKPGSGEADAGVVRTYFKMGVEAAYGAASADSFEWTLKDQNGRSLGGLSVDAGDGALHLLGADGSKTPLPGRLTAGALHKFELILDQSNRSWSARMEAQTLFPDQKIPAWAVFNHLVPGWTSGGDQSPAATLIIDDIRVLRDTASGE